MADELVRSYVDREAFASDTKFILDEINKGRQAIADANEARKSIRVASSGKDIASASEAGAKATTMLSESTKAVTNLMKERFATEAKLVTIQTDYARETAKNRVEIQKTNQELKNKAEYQKAETGSIEKARAAVKILNAERNKLNLYTEEGRARQEKLNAQIDKYNEFIKKNVDALSQQKINVGNYQGSAKIIVDALEKEKQKLEELIKAREKLVNVQNAGSTFKPTVVEGFAGGQPTASAGGGGAIKINTAESVKQLQVLDKQITETRTVVEGFSRVTGQPQFLKLAGSFGDATKELRFFTKALIEMERQGQGNSEAAKALRAHLATLTDEISDAKEEVKALSSDTRGFDLFAGSVTFAADAAQTLVGAMSLMGASEEDAAEATKTLIAIQSVSNGVKGIANELTTKGTAANKLFAFSQLQLKTVFDASATSAARFRAALITTGFGALIVGIGLLVANFDKLKRAMSGVSKQQEEINESLSDYKSAAQGAYEMVNKVSTAFNQAKEGVISKDEALKVYNETLGSSLGYTNDLATAEKNLTDKADAFIKVTALKAQANTLFAKSAEYSAKALTASLEDQTSALDKVVVAIKGTLMGAAYVPGAMANAQNSAVQKAKKEAQDASKILEEEGNKLLSQVAKLQDAFKITDSDTGKDREEARKKAEELAKKARENSLKNQLDLEKKNAAASKQIMIDAANERIRIAQKTVDDENAELFSQFGAINEIQEQKKKLALIEYNDAIKSEKTIEDGKLVVVQKTAIEKKAAKQKLDTELLKISEETTAKEFELQKNATDKFIKELERQKEAQKNAVLSSEDAARDSLQKQYAKDIISLNKKFAAGLLSQEDYNKERLKIDQQYQIDSLNQEITFQKKLIESGTLSPEEKRKALLKLSQLEKELGDLSVKNTLDNEEKKREAIQKTLDEIAKRSQQVFDFIGGMLNASTTKRLNALEDEKTAIDEKSAAEIEAINSSTLKEEEKAAKISIINARAQAEKQRIEQQQKEMQLRQARWEKSVAIFNIILSTAQNVAKAMTPLGKIIAAASGAAQLAVAVATPLPRYFKGKRKGEPVNNGNGFGIVNDHPDGRTMEIIEHADGTFTKPSGRNVVIPLKKDDIVHSNYDEWLANIFFAANKDAFKFIGVKDPEKYDNTGRAMDLQIALLRKIVDKKEVHIGANDGGMVAIHKWGANQIKYIEENTNW